MWVGGWRSEWVGGARGAGGGGGPWANSRTCTAAAPPTRVVDAIEQVHCTPPPASCKPPPPTRILALCWHPFPLPPQLLDAAEQQHRQLSSKEAHVAREAAAVLGELPRTFSRLQRIFGPQVAAPAHATPCRLPILRLPAHLPVRLPALLPAWLLTALRTCLLCLPQGPNALKLRDVVLRIRQGGAETTSDAQVRPWPPSAWGLAAPVILARSGQPRAIGGPNATLPPSCWLGPCSRWLVQARCGDLRAHPSHAGKATPLPWLCRWRPRCARWQSTPPSTSP